MFSDLAINNAWASVGGIGGWNDADMLEVGNKGLTIAEQRTHFALCKRCFTTLLLLLASHPTSSQRRLGRFALHGLLSLYIYISTRHY